MKELFRQYFTLDNHPDQLPTNHGATLVANTAFATVGVIGFIILVPAMIWGEHQAVSIAAILGIVGAINGYFLWRRGNIVLSTTLHAGGLVLSGNLALLGTQTIGGSTGILYLASVITAGGFLGIRGALIDIGAVFLSGIVILLFGDALRPMIGLPIDPFVPPEHIVQLFVFFSIPAWGAYVVAVDLSNRLAWKSAFQNKQRLEKSNHQLQLSQQQQAKVADLGLMALQDVPLTQIEQACWSVFVDVIPKGDVLWPQNKSLSDSEIQALSLDVDIAYSLFVDGLMQIISTRRIREKLIAERARLASELQKEQRLESLSRMAGGVAHDFNNALMVITGIGDDLLTTASPSDKCAKGIETMLSVSRHMSDMTTQLLFFAKGLPIKESPVDVNAIVTDMEGMLKQVLPSHVQLTIAVVDESAIVKLPLDQVERMVLNLVRNSSMAFEGQETGAIKVSVSIRRHIKDDMNTVCIQVEDNGVGMDDETKERAIEPYFSVRGSTGLGLSTVHGLIDQAGGTLDISSRLGEGTVVQLWIPMVQDDRLNIAVGSMEPSKHRGMALLIDDEELVRDSVKLLLENLGWLVLDVGSRVEALEVVSRESEISLVVCDVRLGDEHGFEVVNALQTVGLESAILYITGYASRNQALQHNEHLLVKPFRSNELKEAIQKVLT